MNDIPKKGYWFEILDDGERDWSNSCFFIMYKDSKEIYRSASHRSNVTLDKAHKMKRELIAKDQYGEPPKCPKCNRTMKARIPDKHRNQTWKPFWGCIYYPECKGTRKIGWDDVYDPALYDEYGDR